MVTIGSLDQNRAIGKRMLTDVAYEFVHILETREIRRYRLETIANKIDIGQPLLKAEIDDILMLHIAIITQFAHLTEDERLLLHGDLGKIPNGSRHGRRIGIVGIDDETVVPGLRELAAIVGRDIRLESIANIGSRHTEEHTDTDRSHDILSIVGSDKIGLHVPRRAILHIEPQREEGRIARHLAIDKSFPVFKSIADGRDSLALLRENRIVEVDKDLSACRAQEVIEFAFGPDDTLKATKPLKVCLAYIRDEPGIGGDDVDQRLYFARMIGSHLNYCQLVFGAYGEQRERNSDVIIEIALRMPKVEPAREDGTEQFLGRGLSVGPGNSDDGASPCDTMIGSQLLHGREHIVHEDISIIGNDSRIIDHGEGASTIESLGGVGITVGVLAFQSKKNAPRRSLTTIGSHFGMGFIDTIKLLDGHERKKINFVQIQKSTTERTVRPQGSRLPKHKGTKKKRPQAMSILYKIHPPKELKGQIQLPASKSISNRALILSSLATGREGISYLRNLADCDDTAVMIKALETYYEHSDRSATRTIDIGAAGTSMRFLTAFLSSREGEWELTGSERMQHRPIHLLVEALRSVGASIEYAKEEGYPPLRIHGRTLKGGTIRLKANVSSQYISALLMTAPNFENGLKLQLQGDLISLPYIQLTTRLMEDFGIRATWSEDGHTIEIHPQDYQITPYEIESDWSAASYWYELLALKGTGSFLLKGLRKNSPQGDARIAHYFAHFGVKTTFEEEGVLIECNLTQKETGKTELNFLNEPDMAQTFAVTACLQNRPFVFSGLQTLKIKETDRIAALIQELGKLGYVLYEPSEGQLAWTGQTKEKAETPIIDTYDDHRMALSFAPASILMPLQIRNPEVVSKSYPHYWEDLKSTGFRIEKRESERA